MKKVFTTTLEVMGFLLFMAVLMGGNALACSLIDTCYAVEMAR